MSIIGAATRPGVIFILLYKYVMLQTFEGYILFMTLFILYLHLVEASVLHNFFGFGYYITSIPRKRRYLKFRVLLKICRTEYGRLP